MTPQFNIRFVINRVTEELNLVLTDLSDYTGVTTYYGFYKIIYPDGVVVENTNVDDPDFDNSNAITTIPLRTRKGLIQGEYSITQKTYTDIGDDELEKVFTLSFADPSLIMSDNSNLATPSVSFLDVTQYVNEGYNPSVTRSIECKFPETSPITDTITTTAIEIFMLKDDKTYEGIYKPKLTATALFTADNHEIQWIQEKSFEFDVRAFIPLDDLVELIEKVKNRLDQSQGNKRELMDDYFMVTSLYTQIVAKWGDGIEASALKAIESAKEKALSDIEEAETLSIEALNQIKSSVEQIESDIQVIYTDIQNIAAAAEAAKVAAETAATNAASSAAAAAASKTDAEAAAAAASASQSAAAASQAAAAASAAAALASEIAAGTSETNAAISAAAAAASQSAAAASAAAAAASESAAAASAATATTQAGIATTKAGEAATSATDAEAAKNAVEGILDFTAGNLYRGNGTGIAAINEADFFKNLAVISKSALGAMIDSDNVFAWDNFSRPNTAATATTDSGQSYVQISGSSGLRVEGNYAYKNDFNDIIGVNTGFGSIRFVNTIRIRPLNSVNSIYVGKDANNYARFILDPGDATGVRVDVVVGGVLTKVQSLPFTSVFVAGSVGDSSLITIIFDLIRPGEGGMSCRVNSPQLPSLSLHANLSSYRSTLFPNSSDMAYAGWGVGNNGAAIKISSFYIQKID